MLRPCHGKIRIKKIKFINITIQFTDVNNRFVAQIVCHLQQLARRIFSIFVQCVDSHLHILREDYNIELLSNSSLADDIANTTGFVQHVYKV